MGSVDGFDEGDNDENNEGPAEGIEVGFIVGSAEGIGLLGCADGATEPDDVIDGISEGLGLAAYEGESVAILGTTEGAEVITGA